MKNKVKVVNIKCEGCEKGITDALEAKGLQNISVNVEAQQVSFDGNKEVGVAELTNLGYPEAGTDEAESILKKAKSYETCAVGTVKDGAEYKSKRSIKFWMLVLSPIVLIVLVLLFGMALLGKDMDHDGDRHGMIEGIGMVRGAMSESSGDKFPLLANKDLPSVIPTKVIKLKDGDTYEMTAGIVQQEVGNRTIRRLAYNRMIPGPILKVQKGAHITIKFTNGLDIETTLHSHGLRGKDAFDGLPIEMGGKQKNMKPEETFTYELEFPDTGVFWYHPHLREDYTQEMGLYGNYWVDEKDYWNKVDKEEFVVVDDFSENDPFYKGMTNKTMMGRYGNLLMINNETDYKLQAKTGETVRFFMTNTANTRVFDIALKDTDGNVVPLKVVGGDIGRVEKEFMVEDIIIAPAERYIFEASFAKPGMYTIEHRGKKFGEVLVSGNEQQATETQLRKNTSDYTLLRAQFTALLNRAPDKKLRLTIGMKGQGEMRRGMAHKNGIGEMMGGTTEDIMKEEAELGGIPHMDDKSGIEWGEGMAMMNNMTNDEMMDWYLIDEDTNKVNMNIKDWTFKKGQLVKVRIYNDPDSMHPIQHPIHFHGQRFAVIASDLGHMGTLQANNNLQWKDTTLVRAGETVDVVIEMSNVGDWMAHCHIAEHLHAGMMMNFRVVK